MKISASSPVTLEEAQAAAHVLARYIHAQLSAILEGNSRSVPGSAYPDEARVRHTLARHYRREVALVARLLEIAR